MPANNVIETREHKGDSKECRVDSIKKDTEVKKF